MKTFQEKNAFTPANNYWTVDTFVREDVGSVGDQKPSTPRITAPCALQFAGDPSAHALTSVLNLVINPPPALLAISPVKSAVNTANALRSAVTHVHLVLRGVGGAVTTARDSLATCHAQFHAT